MKVHMCTKKKSKTLPSEIALTRDIARPTPCFFFFFTVNNLYYISFIKIEEIQDGIKSKTRRRAYNFDSRAKAMSNIIYLSPNKTYLKVWKWL